MNITKERAQSILQTLPIGYYLKRNVEVELSETASTSYIDLQTERITISMNNLHTAHKFVVSDEQLEETVRAILYHELSHALLTPKKLNVTNIMNIFEDERIETLLKNFYINVDFKQNISKLVDVNTLNDIEPWDLFFKIVRFRQGPKELVDRVSAIIKKHMNINSETTAELWKYEYDVERLYEDVKLYAEQLKREHATQLEEEEVEHDTNEQSEEQNDESNETENEVENTFINNDCETEDKELTDIETDSEIYTETHANELSEEELDELTDKLISTLNKRMDNSETKQYIKELTPIIKQARTQQSNTGSAINAYSGVFDPRAVMNNDYRYFVQKNRTGHLKQFSKIRLNLYIDRSGSFYYSQDTVNAFLNALSKLEKEITDFEFNVVTIGEGEIVHDKNNRQIECGGGNALTADIFEIMKRLTCTDCTLYNIVLFDGYAFSHDVPYSIRKMSSMSNFKVFNSTNTYIISDYENERVISEYAPLAKTTFTTKYAKDFKQQILNVLQNVFR